MTGGLVGCAAAMNETVDADGWGRLNVSCKKHHQSDAIRIGDEQEGGHLTVEYVGFLNPMPELQVADPRAGQNRSEDLGQA